MKKVIIRTLSAILSISVLLSCIFCLTISADETEARPSCVADHFNRLNGTIIIDNQAVPLVTPSENSCPYAALSMLLSFYDSYWNEGFVQDELEWDKGIYNSSTDELIQTFSAVSEMNEWMSFDDSGKSFREFVISREEEGEKQYLQTYLITIAKEINLCSDDDELFGLNGSQMVNLLEYYLYTKRGFTEDQVVVHIERAIVPGHNDDTLFATMQEHIDAGYPLIYAGYNVTIAGEEVEFAAKLNDTSSNGHAMIAYSNVYSGNTVTNINLHTGWRTDTYSSVNTTEYNSCNLIIWIEINEENLPHQCTDAYHDVATDTDICACQVYYNTHPAHACEKKNDTIISSDSAGHYYECTCGNIVLESHNYTNFVSVDLRHHTAVCAECGYSTLDAHGWQRISLSISMCTYCGQTKDHLNGKPGMVPLDNENEEEIE